MSDKSIGFIGLGNMGAAIASAIHHHFSDVHVYAVESSKDRQGWIQDHLSFVQMVKFSDLFNSCDIIFVAVKPQQFDSIVNDIQPLITSRHVIISMLAGVTTAAIQKNLATDQVIRIMPNTPATLSKGVTGIYFSNECSHGLKASVTDLCNTFGKTIQLQNEADINLITAISGSGPAFFYRMVQAFIQFGVSHQLSEALVKEAAIYTMQGASEMLIDDPNPAAQISRVRSPNGTTHAGLEVMDQEEFDKIIYNVLKGAYVRAEELSKET